MGKCSVCKDELNDNNSVYLSDGAKSRFCRKCRRNFDSGDTYDSGDKVCAAINIRVCTKAKY